VLGDRISPSANFLISYFVYPYAEVDGKPFASVERTTSYRDQPTETPVPTGGVGRWRKAEG
jgi:hypothetical protein